VWRIRDTGVPVALRSLETLGVATTEEGALVLSARLSSKGTAFSFWESPESGVAGTGGSEGLLRGDVEGNSLDRFKGEPPPMPSCGVLEGGEESGKPPMDEGEGGAAAAAKHAASC
jgi:hypothetical protein